MFKSNTSRTINHQSLPLMDPSSSTSQLLMAAFLGASFVAISAFYIHHRHIDHVIDRFLEIRREKRAADEDGADDHDDYDGGDDRSGFGHDGGGTETDTDVRNFHGTLSRSVDENFNVLRSYRISSSMPNVVSAADWFRDDPQNRPSSHDNLQSVPLGLPSLRMGSTNGESAQISSSYKRIASVGRIKTPRSPGPNTFEDADDSDDEGTQLGDDNHIPFYPGTRDSSDA